MAKSFIRLKYDNKVYELTYTRETVKQMERSGFNVQALMSGASAGDMSEQLFAGAFAARHRKLSRKNINEIYEHLDHKDELNAALLELYAATLDTLVSSAAVHDGKNVTWEVV